MSGLCQRCPDASGFTARNVVSRWDVLEAHTRATVNTATSFLDALQARMPFPLRAIQVDGGSEFLPLAGLRRNASTEAYASSCCHLAPPNLRPRGPQPEGSMAAWSARNVHIRSPDASGYEVTEFSLEVAALNRELLTWECTYNTVRPHQALGYLTPHQFVTQWYHQRKEVKCHQSPGRVQFVDNPQGLC